MVVARKGTKKDLMYDGGPANTVKMWEVDGVPVEMMENEKFQENVNGTLTISDIGTIKIVNIRTPKIIAVIILKFEQWFCIQ